MKLVKCLTFILCLINIINFTGCTTVTQPVQNTKPIIKPTLNSDKISFEDEMKTNTIKAVSENGGMLRVYASKAYVDKLYNDAIKYRLPFEDVRKLDPLEYNHVLGTSKRSFENPVLANPHVGFAWNTIPFVIDATTNHLNLGYNNINLPPTGSTTNTPVWYNGGFTYGADNTNRASFIVGQRNDSGRGSFVAAYDSKAGNHDFIFGRYVENKNGCYNFVFNGDWEEPYSGKGIGSFAVNPTFGLHGFWIGEKNLPTILNDFITEWENKTLGAIPRDVGNGRSKGVKPLREENAELKERVMKLEIEMAELKKLLLGIEK